MGCCAGGKKARRGKGRRRAKGRRGGGKIMPRAGKRKARRLAAK